jgi:hypothetical protein
MAALSNRLAVLRRQARAAREANHRPPGPPARPIAHAMPRFTRMGRINALAPFGMLESALSVASSLCS